MEVVVLLLRQACLAAHECLLLLLLQQAHGRHLHPRSACMKHLPGILAGHAKPRSIGQFLLRPCHLPWLRQHRHLLFLRHLPPASRQIFPQIFIPLLLAHFRRSDRGVQVFAAYAVSCIVLLLVSYAIVLLHVDMTTDFGVPAKNAPTQSGEFATCIAGFAYLTFDWIAARKWSWAAGAWK